MSNGAVLTPCVAIRGGGIDVECNLASAWIVEAKRVNDEREAWPKERMFCPVQPGFYRCQKFLKKKKGMVNHIIELRNEKVKELMKALPRAEDPNDNYASSDAATNRPRREMIDQISRVITVDVVTTTGMASSVNLLPTWREREVLAIELTEENLDLLLEDPPAGSAPWSPEINEPDVTWLPRRRELRCQYYDSLKGRRVTKSMQVDFGHCLTDEDKQEQVDKVARELQRYFDENCSDAGPEMYTAEDSDGDDSDGGDSDGAGSNDSGEPQRKRRRRSCSLD